MAKRNPSETPLMRQYLAVKDDYPDAILFFRCGDFYEMFFDDAVKAAELLDIALTSRNKNSDEAVPMAGVPHHAARGYIARLTELGQKVVLCEQVEDARLAKGLVKREVVRVITPGVVLDDELLDPKSARYLAAVASDPASSQHGLAYLDVSTGEFHATEASSLDELVGELGRVRPREILISGGEDQGEQGLRSVLAPLHRHAAFSAIESHTWHHGRELIEAALAGDLAGLGLENKPFAVRAAADVVAYARATQPSGSAACTCTSPVRPWCSTTRPSPTSSSPRP
jgi:DNA mismatch repair protein MutS